MQHNDPFQNTKLQILKQKYEYMTHYRNQTENRVQSLKDHNAALRERVQELENSDAPMNETEWQGRSRLLREEEREKTKKIQELKRLIGEYRYLCQQASKMQGLSSRPCLAQQSARENSFFSQLESSQNENLHNVSISRNKSYQKVKTRMFCQRCETEFRPNQFYRHLEACQQSDFSKSRGKNGYRTMRN